MKKFCCLIVSLITAAISCAGTGTAPAVRMIDATGGAPMEVFISAAMELASAGKMNISMQRGLPSKALDMLDKNEVDAVICDRRFAGNRQQIPLAAEALALYVSSVNPVRDLSPEQAAEILTRARPVWSAYNRLNMDIQRIALRNDLAGGRLLRRIFGNRKFDSEIFFVRSQTSGYAFVNSASLFFAPFVPLPPSAVKMVPVNGVIPTTRTVRSGKYPLSMHYVIVTANKNSDIDKLVKFIASENKYRQQMQNSGLIVLLP
ncbi:MAG: hypothetical protein E7058_03340 [Lentisphaerae bacterium]|nr:hypothetical protein [Lentisphaerota bacterium]